MWHTVNLVIFARFKFSRILREVKTREFKNVASSKNRGKTHNLEIRENLNTRKSPDLQYLKGEYFQMLFTVNDNMLTLSQLVATKIHINLF